MKVRVQDVDLEVNIEESGFSIGNSNYGWEIIESRPHPADFEVIFLGGIGDSILADTNNVASPFMVKNVTENVTMNFKIMDYNLNNKWDSEEPILIQPHPGNQTPYLFVVFSPYDSVITVTNTGDTTIIDTVFEDIVDVEKGDVFSINVNIPFSEKDKYHFTTISSRINNELAESEMKDIAVVPNPYVVTATWEPQHQLVSGRGPRKLDFINLPTECTIKIFTLSGYLVNTLKHSNSNEDGTYSWNMLSRDGLEISYGLYLYHVEAEGIGEFTGKFALIK